ncbi:hypothetical protein J6590_078734, partial [Homalodisca vitripennis]
VNFSVNSDRLLAPRRLSKPPAAAYPRQRSACPKYGGWLESEISHSIEKIRNNVEGLYELINAYGFNPDEILIAFPELLKNQRFQRRNRKLFWPVGYIRSDARRRDKT